MSEPKNSGRLPAFQFYPADWRKDPGVQSLDFETRGIWWEIICLLHESDERGVLLLNGQPMPEDALCRLLGLDNQKLTTALTTLLTYGVAKRRESDNAIYSKRMVADENLRQIRKLAGSKGGNPALLNQKTTTRVKQKPTPSSSSSISSSSKGTCTLEEAKAFAIELGLPETDGESCFHKWTGNGWMNGQNRVKDWKATIRSWHAAGYLPSQKGGKPGAFNGQQKPKHAAYDAKTATAGMTAKQILEF